MRRRSLLGLIGGGAALVACEVHAQSSEPVRRVGVLMGPPEGDVEAQARALGFRRGLEAAGWREGRNVSLEFSWDASEGVGATERAAALVAREPDVILVNTPAGLRALRQLTRGIPIVFVQYVTQEAIGSLAPSGGNTTGFAMLDDTLDSKWLEFLKQIASETRRVAFMQNSEHPSW